MLFSLNFFFYKYVLKMGTTSITFTHKYMNNFYSKDYCFKVIYYKIYIMYRALAKWYCRKITVFNVTNLKIFGCDSLLSSWTSRNIFGRFDRNWFIFSTITWPVVRCVTCKKKRRRTNFIDWFLISIRSPAFYQDHMFIVISEIYLASYWLYSLITFLIIQYATKHLSHMICLYINMVALGFITKQ